MKRIVMLIGVLAVLLFATSGGHVFAQESGYQSLTEAADAGYTREPFSTPEAQQPSSTRIRASASASVTLTFFTDRTQFDAACPNLPVEDFEDANVGDRGIASCPRPADNSSNNLCFSPGDIEPGLSITTIGPDRGGQELAITGAGFFGTTSRDIFATIFVDHIAVDFPAGDVTCVGMDLLSLLGPDPNMQIEIFGTSGLLGSTTAPGTNAGSFWGVQSNQVITQIRIRSLIDTAEGVDNIAFGASISKQQLTSLSPAKVWVGLKNSDAVGLRLDLLAEVFLNADKIGQGQLNNVASGSSGFNNARLNEIDLDLFDSVEVAPGDTLSIKLSVRRTCFGGGQSSGTARLWFNDSQANSHFDATIDDADIDFFLRDGFALATTPGPGPKKTIDVAVNNRVPCPDRPFTPFGTWSTTPSDGDQQ